MGLGQQRSRVLLAGHLCWFLALPLSCGGEANNLSPPAPQTADDATEEPEEVLIPAEKFDDINRMFKRKASTVARCFPRAVDAGELEAGARVQISVGLVILPSGSPSEVEVIEATEHSNVLESCIINTVRLWQFTTLPKSLKYSHGFSLQRF